jgi:hypothetical protein
LPQPLNIIEWDLYRTLIRFPDSVHLLLFFPFSAGLSDMSTLVGFDTGDTQGHYFEQGLVRFLDLFSQARSEAHDVQTLWGRFQKDVGKNTVLKLTILSGVEAASGLLCTAQFQTCTCSDVLQRRRQPGVRRMRNALVSHQFKAAGANSINDPGAFFGVGHLASGKRLVLPVLPSSINWLVVSVARNFS